MTPELYVAWINGYLQLSNALSHRDEGIKSALSKLSPLEFCYFLQGFLECTEDVLTKTELIMYDHLKLVFNKITPKRVEINKDNFNFTKLIEDYNRNKISQDIWNMPHSYPTYPNNKPITIC
jgi:hypothetical protein